MTLLSVAAVGCGSDATPSSAAHTSDTPSATVTTAATTPGTPPAATGSPTAAPPATGGSPSTASPTASAGSPKAQSAASRCKVTDLKLRIGRGDPGAGNVYFPLDFTNTSSHTCTLNGFPGVSLLRGDGSVIGKPANRQPTKAAAVRIAPGQTVEADLHTLNQGIKGDSCWRTPTLLMVYPPGSTDSMTLATPNPVVCGGTFDVGPVH